LEAGVGNKSAAGKDSKAAREREEESRSEILHGDEKEMRIFTGSSDSIRHRTHIRKFGSGVMVCGLYTDKIRTSWWTKPVSSRVKKIGYVIAC
jgi:hypothetical protein